MTKGSWVGILAPSRPAPLPHLRRFERHTDRRLSTNNLETCVCGREIDHISHSTSECAQPSGYSKNTGTIFVANLPASRNIHHGEDSSHQRRGALQDLSTRVRMGADARCGARRRAPHRHGPPARGLWQRARCVRGGFCTRAYTGAVDRTQSSGTRLYPFDQFRNTRKLQCTRAYLTGESSSAWARVVVGVCVCVCVCVCACVHVWGGVVWGGGGGDRLNVSSMQRKLLFIRSSGHIQ